MKTGWAILIAAVLSAGCATTEPVNYGEVPGASPAQTASVVETPPPVPVAEPANSVPPKAGIADNVKNFFANLTKKEEAEFGEVPGPSQTKLELPTPVQPIPVASIESTNVPPVKKAQAKPKPIPTPVVKTPPPAPSANASIVTLDDSQTSTVVAESTNSFPAKPGFGENVKSLFGNLTKKEEPKFGEVPGPSQSNLELPPPVLPSPVVVAEPTNAPPQKKTEAKTKPTPPPVVKTTPPPASKPKTPSADAPIVTPDNSQTGKVVKFNEAARIVVLEFPLTNLPGPERQLFIYRNDLKVGEVKTSRWQNREYVVADLVSGEAKEGDVVRDR